MSIEFIVDDHSTIYTTPPPVFDFQVDLEVNLTIRHARHETMARPPLLCIDMGLFLDTPLAQSRISRLLLADAPADLQPNIAAQIVLKAQWVAHYFRHEAHGRAHITANVYIDCSCLLVSMERAMVQRALAASVRDAGHGMVPAAKEAVRRALKRVRVDNDDDSRKRSRTEAKEKTNCSICLEDIETCGTSMPCSHLFHQGCIVKWLKVSHQCPLCRFQIPTDQVLC